MSEVHTIRQSPLSRVVAAAAVDKYEDFESVQHRYFHWGARGLKLLADQMLKRETRVALLRVNRMTMTAALPCGLDELGPIFVGVINSRGERVPLHSNNALVDLSGLVLPKEETCSKCSQNKKACEELRVSEETTFVEIGGRSYEQVSIKKMQADGSYYLETRIPFVNQQTGDVDYISDKQFIAKLELEDCGCVKPTPENRKIIQCACPDVYYKYFAPCIQTCDNDYGEYKLLPERGFIQFSSRYKFDHVYIEYVDFLSKINGQYFVPEVAFETLVEWIKWRSIKDRKGVERWEKLDQQTAFETARSDMYIVSNRISLRHIIEVTERLPNFDIDWRRRSDCFCTQSERGNITLAPAGPIDEKNRTRFNLSRIVGLQSDSPLADTSIWIHPSLRDAEVEYMIVNNIPVTRISGDFTFDPVQGRIDWSPNKFNTGDVVIIPNIKIV